MRQPGTGLFANHRLPHGCMSAASLFTPSAEPRGKIIPASAIFASGARARMISGLINIQAIAGVVFKELYRRKDFYVLFILTALITISMGSVNFFGEANTARYLKEICLLLIWIASLIIAVTTTARQIPAERESRTIFPLLA